MMVCANAHVPSKRVCTSGSVDVLREILATSTVAAVWQRPADRRVVVDPARLPSHTVERGELLWSDDHRRRSLDSLVDGLDLGAAREELLLDVRFLLERWFEVAAVPHAYVSLAVVADGSCQKLHVDRVGRRLLTTYAGAGTEWLAPTAAAEWRRDRCCYRPSHIERMATGDVLLMKGCLDGDDEGLVHRSPQYEPGAAPRLLLRICDGEYHLARASLSRRLS